MVTFANAAYSLYFESIVPSPSEERYIGEHARLDDMDVLIDQAVFVVVVGADQPVDFFVFVRGQAQFLRDAVNARGLLDVGLEAAEQHGDVGAKSCVFSP